MWQSAVLVFIGGGLGALSRWLVTYWTQTFSLGVSTLTVNLIGCYLIGLLFPILAVHENENGLWKLFFVVGFCGGLTTFSTFSMEIIELIRNNQFILASKLAASNLIGCLLISALGIYSGIKIMKI